VVTGGGVAGGVVTGGVVTGGVVTGGGAAGGAAAGGAACGVDVDRVVFLGLSSWLFLFAEMKGPVRGEAPRLSAPHLVKRDPPDFRPAFASISRTV